MLLNRRTATRASVVVVLGFVASFVGLSASPAVTPASAQTVACDPASTFQVTTTSLPDATQYQSYGAQIQAAGGTAPYTYSISDGFLPDGLAMSSTGLITGVPTISGYYGFQVTATDNANPHGCDTANLEIRVLPSPVSGVLSYLQRAPGCTLATLRAVLGQGPPSC